MGYFFLDITGFGGSYHSTLVHFPIMFFTLTLVCDLFTYFGKTRFMILGNGLLWLGTLMCIPVGITGWWESDGFSLQNSDFFWHVLTSIFLFIYALLYSCLRILIAYKMWRILPIYLVALSCGIVALTSWTSMQGDLLRQSNVSKSEKK